MKQKYCKYGHEFNKENTRVLNKEDGKCVTVIYATTKKVYLSISFVYLLKNGGNGR